MYRTLLSGALDVSVGTLFGTNPRRWSPRATQPASAPQLPADEHLGDVLDHLTSQWHLLVQRANLLGPRHTIPGVREQLGLVTELLAPTRGEDRLKVLQLAARYAESAAWLREDAGQPVEALRWTDQAASFAYEADDELMLAWTMFRRGQQAVTGARAGEVIGLTEAALRRIERPPSQDHPGLL